MEWWEILIIVVVSIIGIVILYFFLKDRATNREYERRLASGELGNQGPDTSNKRIFELTKGINYDDLHPEVSQILEDPRTDPTIPFARVKNNF